MQTHLCTRQETELLVFLSDASDDVGQEGGLAAWGRFVRRDRWP